jgi:tetratricopeptide (TPR) repeat protein
MRALWPGLVLGAALAACEPANDSQRLAMHVQGCQAGLPAARVSACTLVIDAANAAPDARVRALVMRGQLRAALNEDERAFSDFGQALRFSERNTDAYIQRGLLHQKRGAYGPAIADFDAADRIDESSDGADYRQNAIAAELNAFRLQLPDLDRRLAANLKNAALYNDRCWLRAIVGEDLNGALADCNASLAIEPNAPEVLDSRGLVELKRRDYAAAFNDYGAAFAASPNMAHFLYGRGLARVGLGAGDDAVADLRQARLMQPGIDALYESYGLAPLGGVLAKN